MTSTSLNDVRHFAVLDHFAFGEHMQQYKSVLSDIPSVADTESTYFIRFQANSCADPSLDPMLMYYSGGLRRYMWRRETFVETHLHLAAIISSIDALRAGDVSPDIKEFCVQLREWIRKAHSSRAPNASGGNTEYYRIITREVSEMEILPGEISLSQ